MGPPDFNDDWHALGRRLHSPSESAASGSARGTAEDRRGPLAPGAFFERLQRRLHAPAASLALVVIDIKRFHAINVAHGFVVGDQFLEMVGERLLGRLSAGDALTRLGGDEFALLLADVHDVATAVASARQVLGALLAPFVLAGRPRIVSAHAGVALGPAQGRDPRSLLQAARLALRSAKDSGVDVVAARPGQKREPVEAGAAPPRQAEPDPSLFSGRELRDAVLRGEFKVHYQPIHNLGTGHVETLEALVRWRHPTRGLLAPDAFLPAAERAGLAHVISMRVLDCACERLRHWRSRGHADLRVAVNLSAHDFRRDDFAGTVAGTLDRHRLPPSSLELELTEHEQLDDDGAISQAAELARHGVVLTIDDFGVKYSSLRYLHRLPVRALKIDRSFVRDVGESPASNSIVTALIGITGRMGLRLVAEGVEEKRQVTELRRLGCHIMQGFLFSPPVPAEEIGGYLDRAAASAA
jgi:diguanylate cyclase (GGDEF)-like protein